MQSVNLSRCHCNGAQPVIIKLDVPIHIVEERATRAIATPRSAFQFLLKNRGSN